MVIALLVVIVLILLFGAGVVKGWLANGIGMGCGGLAILAALMWLGSFFGENGFAYIVYGILGMLGLLVIIGMAVRDSPPPPPASKCYTPKLDENVREAMQLDRKLAVEFRAKVKANRESDNP